MRHFKQDRFFVCVCVSPPLLSFFHFILLRKKKPPSPISNRMGSQDEANDPYGAIKFGEFRKYMQNKQSKLKRQQKEL